MCVSIFVCPTVYRRRFGPSGHARKYDTRDLESRAVSELIHEIARIHDVQQHIR